MLLILLITKGIKMKTIATTLLAVIFSIVIGPVTLYAQIPELMYFQFNSATGSSVANNAQALTKVSTSGTLNTLTLGSGGQFGDALIGNGGVSSTSNFHSGWSVNLSGPWTMSMWFSGVTNALANNYLFGDAGISFRAFTGSSLVSGAGNLLVRASGMTDVLFTGVFNSTGTPVVLHIVYDPTAPAIRGYVNGVLHTTVTQSSTMSLVGSGFLIGGYGSNNCLPSGAKMDEFRLYNRALSATEIGNTWNIDLLASACPAPTGLTSGSITNNSASLSWNAVTGSQGYEYVLDQTSANPSGAGTPTSSVNYNATGLTPNTTYYMHVRNKCSASSFSSWVTASFTTQNFVSCYPPTIASVTYASTSAVTLSWAPVATSQGYEYVINQSAGNPAGNGTASTGTSAFISGLTPGAGYYAHIRNVCQVGDKSVWLHQPFTMPTCNTPVNVLISNVTDSTADLLWSQMPNVSGYEYAVDFSNQNPTTGISSTTGISAHLTSLVPNSKYYVHTRSRCFGVDSSVWRLDSFVTKMACYAPMVQVNDLGTNTPYAFWDAIPTAIAYEYALTNTPPSPAFGVTIYTTFVSLVLPEDGKDYYLHVRAKCNSMFTFSQWSTVALRTGSTDVRNTARVDRISVYPNPAKDRLYITGTIDEELVITNIAGAVMIRQAAEDKQLHEININALPAGMYLLRVIQEGQLGIVKFVKE